MATTIQVRENTLQLLKEIKGEYNANSLDEVINNLIDLKRKTQKTRFGAHPEMTEFTAADEGEFHEL